MKVALVHDYLNQRGGAERVFAHIARAWPDSPIYTALYDERVAGREFPAARVHRSVPLWPSFTPAHFSRSSPELSSARFWDASVRL